MTDQSATPTLDQLSEVSQQIDRLQAERERLVARARAERRPWQAIADALGVSRQAAWKAHRESVAVVERMRQGSELTEAEAMAIAKTVQREVRRERR